MASGPLTAKAWQNTAHLSPTYLKLIGGAQGHLAKIHNYYASGLEQMGATVPQTTDVDEMARTWIRARFHGVADPDITYRYVSPASAPELKIRLIGLRPLNPAETLGTIIDPRGFTHGLERDSQRPYDLLKAGFEVFTSDRPNHGLSPHLDPREPANRDTDILISSAIPVLKYIKETQDSPLLAIASSLGAMELIGAFRETGHNFGIEAMCLENPLLGPNLTLKQIIFTAVGKVGALKPNFADRRKLFYPKKGLPKPYPGMSTETHKKHIAYAKAFGPLRYPIYMADIAAGTRKNEAWLRSEQGLKIMPRTLATATQGDEIVDAHKTIEIMQVLSGSQRTGDAIRKTAIHSALAAQEDGLLEDFVAFLRNRPAHKRVHVGPRINEFRL